jgi:hypothetical protein
MRFAWRWVLAAAALIAAFLLATACAGQEEEQEGGATITPVNLTATPVEAVLPEGWERHTTANIQVDLPETWDAWELTEETFEAVREVLRNVNPAFASQVEKTLSPEVSEFFAYDTESEEYITNLTVVRQELPFPTTVPAAIAELESLLSSWGLTVLATDSDLTIGGLNAGKITVSMAFDSDEVTQAQYMVQLKPNVVWGLMISAHSDDFDTLEPLFDAIAETFRILESP